MQQNKNSYLATKVLTASPEQLRLMLFDGAVQFSYQAVRALEAQDLETTYDTLSQAKKIVIELITSLKPEVNPDICQKMSAVYTYVYKLMVDSSFEKDPQKLKEAIQILEYERETWRMLIEKAQQEGDQPNQQTQMPQEATNQTQQSRLESAPVPTQAAAKSTTQNTQGGSIGSKWTPGKVTQNFPKQTPPNPGVPPKSRLSVSG